MGNAFVHIELNTDDVAKAQKFYKGLFDWKFKPMAMGYTGVDVGKGTGGGMQKKPMPGSPTMWLPYVQVDSVKKATAKAAKLGGTVMVDHMPIGDMGAIGVFVDPTGAAVGVWEEGKKAAPKKTAAKKAVKKVKKMLKSVTPKAAKKAKKAKKR